VRYRLKLGWHELGARLQLGVILTLYHIQLIFGLVEVIDAMGK
jgi:hypothetical protein